MLAFSCKQAKKPTSESPGDSNLPLDSLVYEQLQAKFDLKFSEIEKEYESASDSRELELDAMYEKLELEMVDPVQQSREDYIKLEVIIDRMELVEIGQIAPDFEMNNMEGIPVKLSSLYPGFDVLGVSTDVRKEQWLAAVELDELIWTNVCSLEKWNDNEVVKTYALRQVSQNFLLDSSGKIIATNLRGEELFHTLEKLMN